MLSLFTSSRRTQLWASTLRPLFFQIFPHIEWSFNLVWNVYFCLTLVRARVPHHLTVPSLASIQKFFVLVVISSPQLGHWTFSGFLFHGGGEDVREEMGEGQWISRPQGVLTKLLVQAEWEVNERPSVEKGCNQIYDE